MGSSMKGLGMNATAHPRSLFHLVIAGVLVCLPCAPILSQDPPAEETASLGNDGQSILALDSVRDSIQSIDERIAVLAREAKTATAAENEGIETEISQLVARRDVLRSDFESIATGIDPAEYDEAAAVKFVLIDEVQGLIRPIVDELKELTKKPREIEQFRSELAIWRKRLETTEAALDNLETLPAGVNPDLAKAIAETKLKWDERHQQAENRIQAITYQLEQAERNQPSLFSSMRDGFKTFFRSRGRNLLLSLLALFGTFLALRYFHQWVNGFTPWVKKGTRPFYTRIVDVGLHLFAAIGAVLAALLVLYAAGDWVLMGLAIVLLLGLIIAAKNGLPKFYAQGRVLMNLGEVREGERVVFNGIPWKVERLSFFATLVNERLRGGTLRLPINRIEGLLSRRISSEGELWFPCQEGDWIELPEAGRGKVISQSPEFVQLVKLGGAKVTIPTAEFLLKSPVNLSHSFRITTNFGIDYKHQADCTTTIPETLWSYLTREMCTLIEDRELLISLKVEFASAGASSLTYVIIADLDGTLAHRYEFLTRALQRFAVDCCHANHWEIPFTQVTLHNAYYEPVKSSPEVGTPKPKLP